jgi:hypothetical protein
MSSGADWRRDPRIRPQLETPYLLMVVGVSGITLYSMLSAMNDSSDTAGSIPTPFTFVFLLLGLGCILYGFREYQRARKSYDALVANDPSGVSANDVPDWRKDPRISTISRLCDIALWTLVLVDVAIAFARVTHFLKPSMSLVIGYAVLQVILILLIVFLRARRRKAYDALAVSSRTSS